MTARVFWLPAMFASFAWLGLDCNCALVRLPGNCESLLASDTKKRRPITS